MVLYVYVGTCFSYIMSLVVYYNLKTNEIFGPFPQERKENMNVDINTMLYNLREYRLILNSFYIQTQRVTIKTRKTAMIAVLKNLNTSLL